MKTYILVRENSEELLRACPDVGRYTGFHRSHLGTNFCEQGDDKAAIIRRIRDLAASKGLTTDEVRDETN